MKILIVTLADQAYWPLARISVPNKAAYAARHGYDFLYCSENWWPDCPASMSKMPLINQYYQDYSWIFWTDVDSLIMNPEIKLESFIDESFELLAHHNQDGLNCGQVLIRGDALWEHIYDNFRKTIGRWVKHPWWEQAAIQEYSQGGAVGDLPASFNRMVPSGPEHNTFAIMRDLINSVWQRDDFILHFAGIGGERASLRLALMEDYLEYLQ